MDHVCQTSDRSAGHFTCVQDPTSTSKEYISSCETIWDRRNTKALQCRRSGSASLQESVAEDFAKELAGGDVPEMPVSYDQALDFETRQDLIASKK